ncbi:hypothetical protein SUDANB95_02637 [Actinosynnema sp. ALI-1.44]
MGMTDQNAKRALDPQVQAAKINRTGAIIGVVTAALITGTATGVAAYFTGREDGVQAANVAPVSTVVSVHTVTASGSSPETTTATSAKPGARSLLDLQHAESGNAAMLVEKQVVNTKSYDRVMTAALRECDHPSASSRTYQLDRKYRRFTTMVGLTDQSSSGIVVEFRVLKDNARVDTATTRVTVGEVKELTVDLTGAFRFTIEMEVIPTRCANWVAGATWIDPTLG